MKIFTSIAGLFALTLLSLAAPTKVPADYSMDQMLFFNSEELHWGEVPPGLPGGAQMTVVMGNPSQPGPFVVRMSTPGEYIIKPHYHSRAETLTVLSGTLFLGGGTAFDPPAAHALTSGGFHYLPAKTPHFAFTKTPTVVEIHGEGPFDIFYLNPGDDPRGMR